MLRSVYIFLAWRGVAAIHACVLSTWARSIAAMGGEWCALLALDARGELAQGTAAAMAAVLELAQRPATTRAAGKGLELA